MGTFAHTTNGPLSSPNLKVLALAITIVVGVSAFFCFAAPKAWADGESARRLGAELIVMKADSHRLQEIGVSVLHRTGLEDRLRGGLAVLPLLIGAARNTSPFYPAMMPETFSQIRESMDSGDWIAVADLLGVLTEIYPFTAAGILPADTRPTAIQRAAAIDEAYCAGCHDSPDLDVPRPAWNLADLAKRMPALEIAARLVIGVRGDAMTGLDNPLTDHEMSALLAYYAKALRP